MMLSTGILRERRMPSVVEPPTWGVITTLSRSLKALALTVPGEGLAGRPEPAESGRLALELRPDHVLPGPLTQLSVHDRRCPCDGHQQGEILLGDRDGPDPGRIGDHHSPLGRGFE